MAPPRQSLLGVGRRSSPHQSSQNVFTIFFDLTILDMKRQKYASDITREQFAQIESELRSVRRTTKPTSLDLYEVFCAALYLLRTGCQWRFCQKISPNGKASMRIGTNGASPTST